MKKILILILLIYSNLIFAQIVDIQMCYHKLSENYPLLRQKEMIKNIGENKIKSLQTNYLPQINLNAQATYQSDVTKIPVEVPFLSFPEIYKDQYKATIDVSQVIWDSGNIQKQKQTELLNNQLEQQNLESEIYKLKERINQLYFNILICRKNIELFDAARKDLEIKLLKTESLVKNGMLNESNSDNLKAEIIKTEQKIIETKSAENATIEMLKEITGIDISENSEFRLPEWENINLNFDIQRPEIKTFELNEQKLSASQQILNTKLLPKIYGFGQFGYGRPGLNMLTGDFESFYIVGAKLSWNLWNWNQTKTDMNVLEIQKNIVNNNKEVYQKNMKINYQRDKAEIEKNIELIKKDEDIVKLKTKIAINSSSQYENGYITSQDYLNDVNAATMAKINYEMHKILLVKAKYDYLVNLGKL